MDIELDFTGVETWSCELGEDPSQWTQELEDGAFLGGQIFKVNGKDFSGDYPLLDFARWLNVIAYHLKLTGTGGFYVDPEFEKGSKTVFSLDDGDVLIAEVDWRTNEVLFSTKVSLDAFAKKAADYLARVYHYCCELFPPLSESKHVQAWLAERPVPAQSQPSQVQESAPAKIVRIGFDE